MTSFTFVQRSREPNSSSIESVVICNVESRTVEFEQSSLFPVLPLRYKFVILGLTFHLYNCHSENHNSYLLRVTDKMSKTVQIGSTGQFDGLLKSSRIVVTDCEFALAFSCFSTLPFEAMHQLCYIRMPRTVADMLNSLCGLVWSLQNSCPRLRAAERSSLTPKPYHFRKDQHRQTDRSRNSLWHHRHTHIHDLQGRQGS